MSEDTYEDDVVDEDEGSLEIEVVDDTPEVDKGIPPYSKEVVKDLDDDTGLEEHSAKVQRRIAQMKKAWHDERRAKETAERERDEATRFAQSTHAERQSLKKQLQDGELWAMDQSKQRAAMQIENAKRSYKEAYEAGDADKLVDAQQALNFSTLEFDRAHHYNPQHTLQTQPDVVYSQPEPAESPKDPRAQDWGTRNKWFGQDDEMTSFALGVHQKLVKEGVSPQTDEYYERINSRMKEVFPVAFEKKRQSSTVVAPVGRSPKGTKVVLTTSMVALSKKLGITPEAYARELVKGMENQNGY